MKRKKCIYFTQQTLYKNDGASNKVFAQKDAICRLGIECHLAYFGKTEGGWGLYLDGAVAVTEIKYQNLYNHLVNHIIQEGYDLMYVRYGGTAGPGYNRFLKTLSNHGVTIYLEIPSYPYDSESTHLTLKGKVKKWMERIYRNRWKGIVYRIITFSTDDEIYGIPTIRLSNAPSQVLPVRNVIHNGDTIRLLAVANLAFWHGYDRLIRGLGNYYKSKPIKKIIFTIVGNGNADYMHELQSLTEDLGLSEVVKFDGPKNSKELDEYFNQADLAIGCLGCHRKNIVQIKSLKNVEYAMRGIPMVYSEENTDFDDKPYVLKVPADESDIDVSKLMEFLKNFNLQPDKIHETVKDYTWENQLHKVFFEIK